LSAPELPEREGYTFLSWYKGDVPYNFNDIVTEDMTLVAKWQINNYKVTWVVDGNTYIENYDYNSIPVFKSSTDKSSDYEYRYKFVGWDKSIGNVKCDITYTALYEKENINYTVIFKNENGDVLSSTTYHYGDAVTVPNNPTKAKDVEYTYTFAGWDKEIIPVSGDVTYTATYNKTLNKYTVTFENEDGTVLSSSIYDYGSTVTEPETPTKTKDVEYTYIFAGWDKEVTTVEGNVTYTATYNKTLNKYTVTFKNEDGTVLSEEEYEYGTSVTLPSNPTKAKDVEYTYIFAGWDKEVTTVEGNVTYTATYNKTLNNIQ